MEPSKELRFEDIEFDGAMLTSPLKPLGEGNYGKTWLLDYAHSDDDEPNKVVVKVLKPTIHHRPGVDPKNDFREEVAFLQKLRHPGIVRIIRKGSCRIDGKESSYYIAEYEDAEPLDKFIVNCASVITLADLFIIAEKILDPLRYCHENNVLHLDLKLDNILIKYNKNHYDQLSIDRCIIIDFGKAKVMNSRDASEFTTAGGGAFDYVHDDLKRYLRTNIVDRNMFNDPRSHRFDLFAVGIILEKLVERSELKKIKDDIVNYLQLFISKLKNKSSDLFDSNAALISLKKNASFGVPTELKKSRITSIGTVSYNKDIQRIIESPEFQRLRDVKQLGLTSLVYPSATHTRLSHSLGTFERAKSYINKLLTHYYFRFEYSKEELDTFLLYCLLHDVGHYPFAHYFEEMGIRELNVSHSYYTYEILENKLCCENRANVISKELKDVFGCSGKDILNSIKHDTMLKSIIDGTIDCDKLDYLIRDGISCGVPYANSIDVDRFISSLTCIKTDTDGYIVGITSKGVPAVETILLARYHLFSEVYWHRVCRSLASMIKNAFYLLFKGGAIDQTELDLAVMNFGDNEFLAWMNTKLKAVNPDAAADLLGNAILSNNKVIYQRLITYSGIWDTYHQNSPCKMLSNCCGTKMQDTNDLKIFIVNELNAYGRSVSSDWINLKEHHLLLDIPPANKDVQSGIFIYYDNDSLGRGKYEFEKVSAFLKSMGESYLHFTKKIRVFVHPMYFNQITSIPDFRRTIDDSISSYLSV